MTNARDSRPYHHGDLRRVLLKAAVASIEESGPGALSLRDLARRADVSHAAPAHHFGDKRGLLTAVATEGFRLFAHDLRAAYESTGGFREVGVAYVRFALAHRPYFEVMFRPDLLDAGDPALAVARDAAAAMLYGPVTTVSGDDPSFDPLLAGVAAWALVHGLATLALGGNLPPRLGDDLEDVARTVAGYLFPAGAGRSKAKPKKGKAGKSKR